MPDANFLQYCATFTGHGVFYVDGVKDLSDGFLLNNIGMPYGVLKKFRRFAARLVRCAEKQKAPSTDPIDAAVPVQDTTHEEQENVPSQ